MKKLMTVLAVVSGVLLCAQAADLYVSPSGNDANTGADVWHAIKSINAAIAALGPEGGTIYLANGTYQEEIPQETDETLGDSALVITAPIVIEGLAKDPTKTIIKRASGTHRLVLLNHQDAALRYVTIQGGLATTKKPGGGIYIGSNGGLVDQCIVTGCKCGGESRAEGGGGIYMAGGRVRRSQILNNNTNNMRHYGSGIYAAGGVIEQCIVRSNSTSHFHTSACNGNGAVALSGSAVMVNSVVAKNKSCLVSGIWVDNSGTCQAINCIAYGNELCTGQHNEGCTRFSGLFCHKIGDTTISPSQEKGKKTAFVNCAAESEAFNESCVLLTSSPFTDFDANDYTLPKSSPAVNRGDTEVSALYLTDDTDYYGEPRVSGDKIDIGISEVHQAEFKIVLTADRYDGNMPDDMTFTFTAEVTGVEGELTYVWNFDDGSEPLETSVPTTVHTYAGFGQYLVSVTVKTGEEEGATLLPERISILPDTYYVDARSMHPLSPYGTPETAATDLAQVLAFADDGNTIYVAPGTYSPSGTYRIEKGVRILGTGDDPRAVIFRNPAGENAVNSGFQNMLVNHPDAFVSGVTLKDGFASYMPGGNLRLQNGTVTNCVLVGGGTNSSGGNSGGVQIENGLLTHCVIEGSRAGNRTAGVFLNQLGGRVSNCLMRNSDPDIAHIISTKAKSSLVKVNAGTIENCTIVDGWLLAKGDPRFAQQTDFDDGLNVAVGARAINCVVADLHYINADDAFAETEPREVPRMVGDRNNGFVNCASDLDKPNASCFVGTLEPNSLFADYAAGDFTPGAVTKNKGAIIEGVDVPSVDLLGNPRVQQTAIDIGCYEVQPAKGISVIIR